MFSGSRQQQQTNVAAALTAAIQKTPQAGRVGRRVLTNNARHGMTGIPAKRKAESAVQGSMA